MRTCGDDFSSGTHGPAAGDAHDDAGAGDRPLPPQAERCLPGSHGVEFPDDLASLLIDLAMRDRQRVDQGGLELPCLRLRLFGGRRQLADGGVPCLRYGCGAWLSNARTSELPLVVS